VRKARTGFKSRVWWLYASKYLLLGGIRSFQ
jgi:hypothetical protein